MKSMNSLSDRTHEGYERGALLRTLDGTVRWPSDEARNWVATALAAFADDARVLAVVLFGSSVRPVEQSSDLDCLVVHRGSERPEPPRPPVDVDIRYYDADTVPPLLQEGHELLGWALRFGVPVWQRAGYWSELKRVWLSRMALPPAEAAELRAVRTERLVRELQEHGDFDAAAEQHLTLLTHRARAALLRAGSFPASRPELASQLRNVGEYRLAHELDAALSERQERARAEAPAVSRVGLST
jgi:hypothetical protein